MKKIVGTGNRILEVNLTTRTVEEFGVTEEERRMYLGGKGLGLKYLFDRMEPGIDPLGEYNILAFMMGVLMGTDAPCSGRFAAVTKSPLTGIMLSSSSGGPFGMAFKTAGYEGLLVTGKSSKPVYLRIDENGVTFEEAAHLWGKDTVETEEILRPGKDDGALVIGPAGENLVLFANIASGGRFLGRGGMGAVMGSKNLKAIVAFGNSYKIVPKDSSAFERAKKRATRYINNNFITSDAYRKYGTNANVKYCKEAGILPVLNFRGGNHENAGKISGETIKEKYNTKHSTCRPCTILCGHKGMYEDGIHKIPEYETSSMLGPNLGIFDTDIIKDWNNLLGRMGMDSISTGATLSYVMECGEKGRIKTGLNFGAPEGITEAINDMALRRGLGNEMADGTRRMSRKYGGKEFAIHVKGLEMPGYDPRGSWGQGLAYAVSNRGGCHLASAVYILETFLGFLNPYTTEAKPQFTCFLENLYSSVNSLHTCLFTTFAYMLEPAIVKLTPRPLLRLVMRYMPRLAIKLMDISVFSNLYESITGIKMSQGDFVGIGRRIQTLERYMNCLEGITRKDDTLPDRFLREGRDCDPKNRTVPLEPMLDKYYRIRGYDKNGIPTPGTLKKLGIDRKLSVPLKKRSTK